MKSSLNLFLCVIAFAAMAGCATTTGSDPVVVESERTIKLAFTGVDAFLEWEHANRAIVPSDVTRTADTLRSTFPPAHASAVHVLRAYKANRTAETKANVQTWTATIGVMLQEALKYLPTPQAKTLYAKAGVRP